MENARKEMAENAAARAQVYALLANIFRAEPERAFLDEIRDPRFSGVLAEMNIELGGAFFEAPEDQALEQLGVEYARLFLGPGPHISPHESVFAELDGGEGGLWGKRTVAVKKFIETAGFDYNSQFTGLPDHISVELEFMQKLAEAEAEKWREGESDRARWCLAVQRKFFEDHLMQWVPDFCDQVIEKAQMPFYGEMAALTKDFVSFDQRQVMQNMSADAGI